MFSEPSSLAVGAVFVVVEVNVGLVAVPPSVHVGALVVVVVVNVGMVAVPPWVHWLWS